MASLYDVADAIREIGAQLRAAGEEAEKTAEKVQEQNRRETRSGITNPVEARLVGSDTAALGNDADSAMRMVLAIQDATRR